MRFLSDTHMKNIERISEKIIAQDYQNLHHFMRGEALAQVKRAYVAQIPIPKFDLSDSIHKAQHNKLVTLVEQMLSAQKEVHLTTSDSTKNVLHQKISILDKQIDKLVYELFSLTEKEIQIVEDGAI